MVWSGSRAKERAVLAKLLTRFVDQTTAEAARPD